MPYLPTAQSFLEQATLLISARPTTARITTKYNVPHPDPPPHPYKPSLKRKPDTSSTTSPDYIALRENTGENPKKRKRTYAETKQQPNLMLKCYDPAGGTCLKYQTDKAAEVGRLVAALGKCGRIMAGLPAPEEEGGEREAVEAEALEKANAAPLKEPGGGVKGKDGPKDGKQQQNQGQGQSGAGKKKKKGKR
ncbi:uncharacterized protein KY384_004927 [Bacidia gigantensis]|uniref:uncharacterized protein n=1 Tax=Bacidia gigantensis TaxID=2732470 RepID=UPI001D037E54|nr:uncharacterized protein KY384_004927 [Bacidia gigantensis]KAG8530425.1 hypothetical protein KY384_004927 [Bacidia gigantensis]